MTDTGLAIVRPLALCIRVPDESSEPSAISAGRPFQHLLIPVRIAECKYWTPPDVALNTHRLAGAIVDEHRLRFTNQYRVAIAQLEAKFPLAAHDLLRRDAVDPFRPGPHEIDAATGHDEGLEPICTQVREQFQHW